jgi:hypothetical protein
LAYDDDLELLVRRLQPVLSEMVGSSIKEALDVVHLQRAIPGTVLAVNGSLCVVQMDDGGVPTSSTPGQVECIRMNGVAVGSRVRVHFFPDASAEAHRVAG